MAVDEGLDVHDRGDRHVRVDHEEAGEEFDDVRHEDREVCRGQVVDACVIQGLDDEVLEDRVETIGGVKGSGDRFADTGLHGLFLQVLLKGGEERVDIEFVAVQELLAHDDGQDGTEAVLVLVDEVVTGADEVESDGPHEFLFKLGQEHLVRLVLRDDAVGQVDLVVDKAVRFVLFGNFMGFHGVEEFFHGFALGGVAGTGVALRRIVPDTAVTSKAVFLHRHKGNDVVRVDEGPDVVVFGAGQAVGDHGALGSLEGHRVKVFLTEGDAGVFQSTFIDGCGSQVRDRAATAVAVEPEFDMALDVVVLDVLFQSGQEFFLVGGEVLMLPVASEVEVAAPFGAVTRTAETDRDERAVLVCQLFAADGEADGVRLRMVDETFRSIVVLEAELLEQCLDVLVFLRPVVTRVVRRHGGQRDAVRRRHEADVRGRSGRVEVEVVIGVVHAAVPVPVIARVVTEGVPFCVGEAHIVVLPGCRCRFHAAGHEAEDHDHGEQNGDHFSSFLHFRSSCSVGAM